MRESLYIATNSCLSANLRILFVSAVQQRSFEAVPQKHMYIRFLYLLNTAILFYRILVA